jgi:hypothetical protein
MERAIQISEFQGKKKMNIMAIDFSVTTTLPKISARFNRGLYFSPT